MMIDTKDLKVRRGAMWVQGSTICYHDHHGFMRTVQGELVRDLLAESPDKRWVMWLFWAAVWVVTALGLYAGVAVIVEAIR